MIVKVEKDSEEDGYENVTIWLSSFIRFVEKSKLCKECKGKSRVCTEEFDLVEGCKMHNHPKCQLCKGTGSQLNSFEDARDEYSSYLNSQFKKVIDELLESARADYLLIGLSDGEIAALRKRLR